MNKAEQQTQDMHEVQDIKIQSLKEYPQETEDNIFVVDCETGGLKADMNSLLDIHFRSLQSDWKRTFTFKPINTCEHEALCVNRLNWIDLISRKETTSDTNADAIYKIFDKHPIIIGNNIEFDLKFIKQYLYVKNMSGHYAICTMRLAKKLLKGRKDSFSLKSLSMNYVGEYDESKAHTAEYDCYLTENLLRKLLEDDKEDILKLKWLAEESKSAKE